MSARLPDCIEGQVRRPMLDNYDLAVHMEIEGITDQVAQSVYDYDGTLEMAELHFQKLKMARPALSNSNIKETIFEYVKGLAFALPVLISALVMVRFSVSLWGGELDMENAAAVAIGTLSSFLTTGGLVQVMAWRVLFYLTTGDPGKAAATCGLWLRRGVLVLFGSGCAGWLVNEYFRWLPNSLSLVAIGFHVALGLLWLASGALYTLEGMVWISVATASGLAAAGLLRYGFEVSLYGSQFSGLAVAIGISATAAHQIFNQKAGRRFPKGERMPLARLVHTAAPYFLYGLLYYCFLFADRWIAWTGKTASETLPIFFRGDYEAGLDVALIAFVFGAGWVHASTHSFFSAMQRSLSGYNVVQTREFNRAMFRFYLTRLACFLPFAVLTCMVVYWAGVQVDVLSTAVMRKVCGIALVGFLFLVVGLWNASLFFAFSLPFHTLRAMVVGLCGDLVVSYVCSRMGHYSDAVYGFATGAFFFALLSTWLCCKELKKADHLQFAASV